MFIYALSIVCVMCLDIALSFMLHLITVREFHLLLTSLKEGSAFPYLIQSTVFRRLLTLFVVNFNDITSLSGLYVST